MNLHEKLNTVEFPARETLSFQRTQRQRVRALVGPVG